MAERASTHIQTISNFEKDTKTPSKKTLEQIIKAIEVAGIECMDDGGIRPQQPKIRVLQGQNGFSDFYDDIYQTIKNKGGNILINNADEEIFWKWMGDKKISHGERMSKLSNFTQKIIIKDRSEPIRPAYKTTTYRLLPAKQFSGVPFYVYGDKLAIIHFEPENVHVFIIEQANIAKAYEKTFLTLWDICKIPERVEKCLY